jgi:hypothetical protein
MFGNIGEKVTTSVLSATILGVLAFGWSFTSSGGLVKALGGVSKAEFETALQNNPGPQGPKEGTGPAGPPGLIGDAGIIGAAGLQGPKGDPGNAAKIPKDAVVAFADDSCPSGWSRYTKAHGRMIVGATENAEFITEYSKGSDGKQLPFKKFGEHGGQATVTLTEDQMPIHGHFLFSNSFAPGGRSVNKGSAVQARGSGGNLNQHEYALTGTTVAGLPDVGLSGQAGGKKPHPNMPPYIALYFCKKD